MTALFVLPAIDPKVTGYLLRSLHPSLHERLLIVDNSRGGIKWRKPGVTVDRDGSNRGVSKSWNIGVRAAQERGCSAVVLLSGNVRFGRTGGTDLAELADAATTVRAIGPCHWHTIIFPLTVFERIGLFDECYFPGYYEDCDALRRLTIAGMEIDFSGSVDARLGRDGHGSDRLRQDHPGLPTINYDALHEYWWRKWNVDHNLAADLTQGHLTPFGLPVGLDYWEPATVAELLARYDIHGT